MQSVVIFPFLWKKKKLKVQFILLNDYCALDMQRIGKERTFSITPKRNTCIFTLFVQIYPKYILYIQIYLNISCIKEYRKSASEIIFCTGTFLHLDKVITLLMSQSTYIFWFIPWTHLYGWERAIFEKCLCIIKTLTKLLF